MADRVAVEETDELYSLPENIGSRLRELIVPYLQKVLLTHDSIAQVSVFLFYHQQIGLQCFEVKRIYCGKDKIEKSPPQIGWPCHEGNVFEGKKNAEYLTDEVRYSLLPDTVYT